MGLFSGLLMLPLAPVRGVAWVAEQVAEETYRQMYDEDQIKRELVQLEIESDDGLISDEERGLREDELLERLATVQWMRRSEQAPPEWQEASDA